MRGSCEHCGASFERSRKESYRQFAERRFCGLPCANGGSDHGQSQSPEWKAWSSMRSRCLLETDREYPNYGGRGIRIDPRWDDSAAFLEDMGPRPSPRHSLDRIDNDKGYGPDNCRWATPAQQSQNRRATKLTPVAVMCIRVLRERGARIAVLAGAFGVSETAVSNVVARRTWKNVA